MDISYNWIYKGPCITSVFVNLFFLGWIVYVLVSKFHTDISDHAAMKKTAKAIGKAKVKVTRKFSKGQIISKANCQAQGFFKKNERKHVAY